jgi:hypothetical protein
MAASGQNRRFEERYPNGCFPIHKRSLRGGPANGRFWPKTAVQPVKVRSRPISAIQVP